MQIHLILVFILVTVAAVAIVANRTRIPAAILLVLVGLVLSVTPGLPRVELTPELVLLLVVPPLIYSAGVAMSWREFRSNIRSITLLAVGGVIFTTAAVAAVATGTFSFGSAFLVFIAIMVGEIAFGLAIGYASLRVRRWASDPRVEIILSLLTPFAAYLPPAALGGSGVLATVVCGLYISWNGPLLIPSHTRL